MNRLMVCLMVFAAVLGKALGADINDHCTKEIDNFLKVPSKLHLAALQQSEHEACWETIGSSNEKLNALVAVVRKGNISAAKYLASNLKHLDGGNLEDALISLGDYSVTRMASFLDFARTGVITDRELADSLTMLSPSMSDEPKTQLKAMKARHKAVSQVLQSNLSKYKVIALAAIDAALDEIKRAPQSD